MEEEALDMEDLGNEEEEQQHAPASPLGYGPRPQQAVAGSSTLQKHERHQQPPLTSESDKMPLEEALHRSAVIQDNALRRYRAMAQGKVMQDALYTPWEESTVERAQLTSTKRPPVPWAEQTPYSSVSSVRSKEVDKRVSTLYWCKGLFEKQTRAMDFVDTRIRQMTEDLAHLQKGIHAVQSKHMQKYERLEVGLAALEHRMDVNEKLKKLGSELRSTTTSTKPPAAHPRDMGEVEELSQRIEAIGNVLGSLERGLEERLASLRERDKILGTQVEGLNAEQDTTTRWLEDHQLQVDEELSIVRGELEAERAFARSLRTENQQLRQDLQEALRVAEQRLGRYAEDKAQRVGDNLQQNLGEQLATAEERMQQRMQEELKTQLADSTRTVLREAETILSSKVKDARSSLEARQRQMITDRVGQSTSRLMTTLDTTVARALREESQKVVAKVVDELDSKIAEDIVRHSKDQKEDMARLFKDKQSQLESKLAVDLEEAVGVLRTKVQVGIADAVTEKIREEMARALKRRDEGEKVQARRSKFFAEMEGQWMDMQLKSKTYMEDAIATAVEERMQELETRFTSRTDDALDAGMRGVEDRVKHASQKALTESLRESAVKMQTDLSSRVVEVVREQMEDTEARLTRAAETGTRSLRTTVEAVKGQTEENASNVKAVGARVGQMEHRLGPALQDIADRNTNVHEEVTALKTEMRGLKRRLLGMLSTFQQMADADTPSKVKE